MTTIYMGINTEPDWLHADDVIRRWEAEGDERMVSQWKNLKTKSLALRNEIRETVESEGSCQLSWDCIGRACHEIHAHRWREAMPEYQFEIGSNYECIVRKRGE